MMKNVAFPYVKYMLHTYLYMTTCFILSVCLLWHLLSVLFKVLYPSAKKWACIMQKVKKSRLSTIFVNRHFIICQQLSERIVETNYDPWLRNTIWFLLFNLFEQTTKTSWYLIILFVTFFTILFNQTLQIFQLILKYLFEKHNQLLVEQLLVTARLL